VGWQVVDRAAALDRAQTDGVGFAGFAAGGTGQLPGDPDLIARPDPASYVALPFVRPGLAMVQCDPYVNGEPWPSAPRNILRRLCERLAADGRSLRVGAECEYFLVQLANYLRALTMETTMLARACGKSDVHRLEPEDLVALTVEAAAMARVPLAGTDWIPGR